ITVNSLGELAPAGQADQVGGSHGGRGGPHNSHVSQPIFGVFDRPTSLGHGAKYSSAHLRGGGAIKIEAVSLDLAGRIEANGQTWASDYNYTPGAAGGSVWL